MSETNLEQFREVTPEGRFTLQNSAMLKVRLENDQIQAKLGTMVAYQGDVRFEYKSGAWAVSPRRPLRARASS